jgi:hypothetical protein
MLTIGATICPGPDQPALGKTPRVKMDGFRVPLVTRCS